MFQLNSDQYEVGELYATIVFFFLLNLVLHCQKSQSVKPKGRPGGREK